jgi:hypothetical protein
MLLDMSVVAFAFVAFDHVIMLLSPRTSGTGGATPIPGSEALTTLKASRELITGTLWPICAHLKDMDATPSEPSICPLTPSSRKTW